MAHRSATLCLEIPPGELRTIHVYGSPATIRNEGTKPLYARLRARSFSVNDRRPAAYGNPNFTKDAK